MKRYEEYKDSGNITILDIPSHWESIKMKYCFHQRSEKGFTDEQPLCSTQSQGVIPQSMYDNRVVVVNTGLENQKLVKVGDFVISLRSFQGGIEYAYYQGVISAAYTILTPKDVRNSEYFKYLFKAFPFIKTLQLCVTGIREGQNINYAELGKRNIPLPPLPEQQAIVSFLDTKTSQIDTYIAGKGKEIDLLKSTKQRIIADAVTKGITPGVVMKDSGIAWVGKIPAHWKVQKLKTIVEERKEKNKGNLETNVLSLSYGRIIRKKNVNAGLCPDDYSTYQIVEPGNIILRLTDLQNDHRSLRTGLVLEKGIITSAYICLQTVKDPFYLQQILHSYDLMKVFYTMGDGLRQSMSYKDVCSLFIPIAPVEEQQSIVAFIKEKTEAIDSAIEKLENQIELMKQYKQRLISDVVTGQIKVC